MIRSALLVTLILASLGVQTPPAAAPPKTETAPVLSEVDRLKVVNALQAIDLATARLQLAAAELTRARTDGDALVKSLALPGWVLNEKLEYVRPAKDGGGR